MSENNEKSLFPEAKGDAMTCLVLSKETFSLPSQTKRSGESSIPEKLELEHVLHFLWMDLLINPLIVSTIVPLSVDPAPL